jgi:hypothetical protein
VEKQMGRKQVDRMLADLFAGRSAPSLRLWFPLCVNVWLNGLQRAAPHRDLSTKVLIEGGIP